MTNTLNTVEIRLQKEVFGYDDGKVFFIEYTANQSQFESYSPEFTDREGKKRSVFHHDGWTTMKAIVAIRPEDGIISFKVPYGTAYHLVECVPKRGAEVPAYEDLVEYVKQGNYLRDMRQFSSPVDYYETGYYESSSHGADQSGSMYYGDLEFKYINASRMVSFEKKDENGNPVIGARMQLLFTPPGSSGYLITEWVTDGKPHVITVNSNGKIFINGWGWDTYYLTLHEAEAPEGYLPAEDIPFKILMKPFTTQYHKHGNMNSNDTAEGWYPYIDTGDGQEKFTLTMTDECKEHDVTISKQDVNGKELAGAALTVTGRETGADADITPISWTSGSDGHVDEADETSALKPHTVKSETWQLCSA